MASFKVDLELQKKIIDLVGSDKYRELMRLIHENGLILVDDKIGGISIDLPSIEIVAPANAQHKGPIRRFQFVLKMNGHEVENLKRVEIDPFDTTCGDPLGVKLTIIPDLQPKEEA